MAVRNGKTFTLTEPTISGSSSMIKPTLVLDDILDPKKGWPFNQHQVPIERDITDDGTPYYILTVDGVLVTANENTSWADGEKSLLDPTCIAIMAQIEGLKIDSFEDPCDMFHKLLEDGFGSKGSCCPGFDEDGQGYFLSSLPFAEGFPVEWLRKQFMVSVGLIAEQTRHLERALAENSPDVVEDHEEKSNESTESNSGFTSKIVNVAGSVAGVMLRAFFFDN